MVRAKCRRLGYSALVGILGLLSGCGGGEETSSSAVVVEGDFPVVFAMREVSAVGNPTDGAMFAPGGDLMLKDLSSPTAPLVNLTADYTLGEGDVSDPEVSYDGERVLFSMRGPNDPTWNVYELDLPSRVLRRIIADDATANAGDDVDPAYLPDGRIVFSSNRQEKSRRLLAERNIEPYAYRDEYERERVIALHVMAADGSDIRQISFNQSHDRNPTVLTTGEILFARWDHVGNRNHFPLFITNPDGTNIFVQYGAFSPGNSFLHPREMPDGRVMSSLMPLSGTREGGALVAVDIRNFAEAGERVPGAPADAVAQEQLTLFPIDFGRGVSEYGRYTTPYPLWDGTNRALVSWSPLRPEMEFNPVTGQEEEVEGPPLYGVYMFDLDTKSLRPIALPPEGWAYTDPVAVQARPAPNTIPDKPLDAELAAEGVGILNVKSVYDTDGLGLMGVGMLVDGETIPLTAPPPDDTRSSVADLLTLKDPALTTAAERPARFVRVTEAVPTPPGVSREAIGETDLEMQQILGYAEIEPDGSFRIKVPADTPLGVVAVDAHGRAIQVHTNWLQVRPGETRTCNGCHSPRRGSALNSAPIAGFHPNATMTGELGESMAETRTRLDPVAMELSFDLVYEDVWTDPAQAGRDPDAPLVISYDGLPPGAPAPVAGIINYPDHIQPLWEADRGESTCIDCHLSDDPQDPMSAGLDLRSTTAGSGRLKSYEEIMVGDPVLDPDTGLPQLRIMQDGSIEIVRAAPLVRTGGSRDSARSAGLMAKLFEQPLRSGRELVSPPTVDHSGMLNASELRLLAEWIDLGGQYYNDPFDDANEDGFRALSEVRGGLQGLSEQLFAATVHPVLMSQCAACHQPFGNTGSPSTPNDPVNAGFQTSRYVLTGNVEGDFNASVSMVSDVCDPPSNYLLLRPSSIETDDPPHPRIGVDPAVPDSGTPVLAPDSAGWQAIHDWIAAGNCGT
jgi:mono/diheme cytochrome c family protein